MTELTLPSARCRPGGATSSGPTASRGGSPAAGADTFPEELLDAGLLTATGVPGVYGRGRDFERIRLASTRS